MAPVSAQPSSAQPSSAQPSSGQRPGAPRTFPARCRVAALLFAVGVLVLLVGAGGSYSDAPLKLPQDSWWYLLPLAIACVGVLVGQPRPVLAVSIAGFAMVVDVLCGGSIGVVIAFTDTLYVGYSGLRARGRQRLETVLAAVVVVGGLTLVLFVGDLRLALMTTLSGAALVLVPIWWARDVQRTAQFAEVEAERARLAAERVVREERAAMARDLHDVVAGHLSAIALQSEAALTAVRASGRDVPAQRALEVLTAIRAAGVESLTEMRTMIHLMRAGASDDPVTTAPGLAAVEGTVATARRTGLDVVLDVRGLDAQGLEVPVAPATGQAVHRILQEALTNARKHAGPGPVRVVLERRGGDVLLDVTSAPAIRPLLHPVTGSGHGLLTMSERAQALGGTLTAGPVLDGSWSVRARIPAAIPAAVIA